MTPRRFAGLVALALLVLMGGLWASGTILLPADYLAWYYPFQAYPHYADRGYFVQNHGLQDALCVYYPALDYLHETLRQGSFPWWGPLEGVGLPAAALHGDGLLFPVHWLTYGLLPTLVAWHVELALLAGLGAICSFLLFRRVSGSSEGAAIGATAWTLGGWSSAYFLIPPYAWVLALFPAALLAVERARDRERLGLLQLGVAVALILLVGHLQVSFPALAIIAGYVLWRGRGRRLVLLAGVGAGVLLATPHLVPLFELLSLSERTRLPVELLVSALLLPREFLCMVFPSLLGRPQDNFYFGSYLASPIINGREHCVFIGVIVFCLALLAFRRGDEPSIRPVGILAILGLALAGVPLLFAGMCALVPGLLFLTPTRFLPFVLWGLCWLAVFGWRSLERRPLQKSEARALIGVLVFFLVGALSFILPAMSYTASFQEWLYFMTTKNFAVKPPHFPGDFSHLFVARVLEHFSFTEPTILVSFCVVLATAGLCWKGVGKAPRFWPVYSVLLLDLLVYFFTMNVPVDGSLMDRDLPDFTHLARGTTMTRGAGEMPSRALALGGGPEPNLLLPYGIANLEAYESAHPGDYRALIEALNGDFSLPHQSCVYIGKSRLSEGALDLVGVRHLYNRHDRWDTRYGEPDWVGGVAVRSRDTELRAFLVDSYRLSDRKGALKAVMAEGFDPRSDALLDRAPSFGSSATKHFSPAKPLVYTGNEVTFAVETERPTLLVLTDLFYPGWEATVNGRTVPILKAYGFARAVEVPAGASKVRFRFRPTGFSLSLASMALALVGLLSVSALELRAERRGVVE